FYAVDGLGSTRALTDSSGAVTDRYVYDAFGRTISQTGSTVNVYLFAGEQRDSSDGMDYLRARYFDGQTGRFLSRDRATGVPVAPLSWHRYIYADANPINSVDPSGLQTATLAETSAVVSILDTLATLSFLSYLRQGFQTINARIDQSLDLVEKEEL